MPRRRAGAAGVILAVALGLAGFTGCGDDGEVDTGHDEPPAPSADPTVAVEDAQETWAPLVDEVVAAVGTTSAGSASTDGDPETVYYDGELDRCTYSSLRYEFATVFGEETSWDDVRAAVGDVTVPRGFEVTDQLDIPGGHNGFDAATDDGTRLEVRSKLGQPSTVSLLAPLLGSCDRERSETLAPLPSLTS